jgi:hypothetical protein
MANESDADRIQRDKDRRRAEERLRIEREHHRRLHDVEALRRNPLHAEFGGGAHEESKRAEDSPPETPPTALARDSAPEAAPVPTEVTPRRPRASKPEPEPPHRQIGRPLQSDTVRHFLALDPAEQFDIEALNLLPFAPLLHEGGDDPELLALLAERSEALMERVKREVDDPLNAGALLREFALKWYRESPTQPNWGETMPPRWGGIFGDSKASGGKLHPWINSRLWAVHQRSVREGGVRHRVRHGLSRSHVAENSVNRTVSQQIQSEVAQAFIDDIASRPRKPESSFPLIRLSELAVRRQVPTVNDALAALFSSSESGPFVILHPNRYPDCEEVQLRPPSGVASGAALAYSLVSPKGARKTSRGTSPSEGVAAGETSTGSPPPVDESEGVDATLIWDAKTVSAANWRAVFEESLHEKRRLDAPPRDYRSRPSYTGLRALLLKDDELRKMFLSVKWRGRPAGMPLLVTLIQKGTLVPEVSTDHEYLEAELGEVCQGDPQFVPEGGVWKFPGWVVEREGTHREGFRYTAHPETASST